LRHGGEQLFVVGDPRVGRQFGPAAVVHHDDPAYARQPVDQRPHPRHQRAVDEQHVVGRVVDDVADLVVEEPVVEGVQHPAAARRGEVELDVPLRVPAERADPALAGHLQRVEHRGQPPGPRDHGRPRGDDLAGRRCGDHALVSEELLHPPHEGGHVQG
jgi:hypothetical protein